MTNQVIPDAAVEAVVDALVESRLGDHKGINGEEFVEAAIAALEAAAPHIAAQALTDAVEAFPLETITAPDNAVVWLMRRAEQIRNQG